jgi:hypothetical protein
LFLDEETLHIGNSWSLGTDLDEQGSKRLKLTHYGDETTSHVLAHPTDGLGGGGGGGGGSTISKISFAGDSDRLALADPFYTDGNISLGWRKSAFGGDIELVMLTEAFNNGDLRTNAFLHGTIQWVRKLIEQPNTVYDLLPQNVTIGETCEITISAQTDTDYPLYTLILHYAGTNVNCIVEKFDGSVAGVGPAGPAGPAGPSGLEVGTKADMLAKTDMTEGTQFYMNANLGTSFTSQENKLWTYTGRTWQVIGETVEMQVEVDMIEGNTVEVGVLNDYEVKLTNSLEDVDVIGVIALQGVTAGEWGTVATRGIWEVACENDVYNRSIYLTCDATDGLATKTSSVSDQPFAKVVENRSINIAGGLVFALLHTAEIY